ARLFLGDVCLLNGNDRGGGSGFPVIGKFAAHKNAVARLEVRQLDGRDILKSFWPGAMRTSFAGSWTWMITSAPASVVKTMVFPEIDLIVPTGRAAAGACAEDCCPASFSAA